jgi:GntR family transcriptional regulator
MKLETKFLHEEVYESIKSKIDNNEYELGKPLPREIDLSAIYKVSRQTVRKVLEKLKYEGYIYTIKGKGTFVKGKKTDYYLSNIESFSEIISKQGATPNSIILCAKLIEADPRIANELSMPIGSNCFYVERVRKADDVIMCYEETYISSDLCPELDKYVSPNSSLYSLYENRYKLELGKGDFRLEATQATAKIAEMLRIRSHEPVLYMRANVKLSNGKQLYYVDAYYVGSKYVFTTSLERKKPM